MAVAATGFFDGVHRGHRDVLDALLSSASARGEESLVLTMWPHPRVVLGQDSRGFSILQGLEDKISVLHSCGVSRIELMPFSREFASMTAADYLGMLRSDYGVDCVVLGYDNSFGSDLLPTSRIAEIASQMGMESVIVPAATTSDGTAISSTRIRNVLQEGDVAAAAEMLGRPYCVRGTVVHGRGVGRTIGFPTANLQLAEPCQTLPRAGVYSTSVFVDGREYAALTNIDASGKVETHIPGFLADIYGYELAVRFSRRLRGEMDFKSLDSLRSQILRDLTSI